MYIYIYIYIYIHHTYIYIYIYIHTHTICPERGALEPARQMVVGIVITLNPKP